MNEKDELIDILKIICYQKENKVYNVKYGKANYLSLVIIELNKLENISYLYNDELLLISKYIRRHLFNKYKNKCIFKVISKLNIIFEAFSNSIAEYTFWQLDTVLCYAKALLNCFSNYVSEILKEKLMADINLSNIKNNFFPVE